VVVWCAVRGSAVQTAVQLGTGATPLGFFTWATTVTGTLTPPPSLPVPFACASAHVVSAWSVPVCVCCAVNNNVTGVAVIPSGYVADTGANAETDLDSDDGEQSQRCYYSFNYVRPTQVYWDPEIGTVCVRVLWRVARFSFPFSLLQVTRRLVRPRPPRPLLPLWW
jgi:hypothetical protein